MQSSEMFDKLKRYRERQKDGKIAVKVDFQILVTRISGLPRSLSKTKASFERQGKVINLPSGSPGIGELQSNNQPQSAHKSYQYISPFLDIIDG